MSLKHFPELCSSTDSPIHLCGVYNNVLLLFYVNICYCTGSAFFFPPTFLLIRTLPGKCGLTETIPGDIVIYSSVTGYNLSGNVHGAGVEVSCGRLTQVSRESLPPVPRTWVLYGWRFWGLDMGSQFLSSSFASLQGWTSQAVSPCTRWQRDGLQSVFGWRTYLWAPKLLETEVGKGLCQQIAGYMWNTMGQRWSYYPF